MYTMPKQYLIESDDGFSVHMKGGIGRLEYREGDKVMYFGAEYMARGPVLLVVHDSKGKTWESPHDKQAVDAGKHRQILINIINAFASQNLIVEIRPPFWWSPEPEHFRATHEVIIRVPNFERTGHQKVTNSSGYVVEMNGNHVSYRYNDLIAEVRIETTATATRIYPASMTIRETHEAPRPATDQERQTIMPRIESSLKFLKVEYQTL